MAGITFLRAMRAAPSTPQRTFTAASAPGGQESPRLADLHARRVRLAALLHEASGEGPALRGVTHGLRRARGARERVVAARRGAERGLVFGQGALGVARLQQQVGEQ